MIPGRGYVERRCFPPGPACCYTVLGLAILVFVSLSVRWGNVQSQGRFHSAIAAWYLLWGCLGTFLTFF